MKGICVYRSRHTLSVEVLVQLFPGTVSEPYMLEQYGVLPGLLLGGVEWVVGCGDGVPNRLSLAGLQFLVHRTDALGRGVPCLRLYLLPTGRHVSDDGARGSSLPHIPTWPGIQCSPTCFSARSDTVRCAVCR